MLDHPTATQTLESLSDKAKKLAAESDRLRSSLIENILESRQLLEQIEELRAQMALGNRRLDGDILKDLEIAAVLNALDKAGGNRTHAAKMLGISVRTIQRKLKSLGWLDGVDSNGSHHAHQRAS